MLKFRLLPEEPNFNFMALRYPAYVLSLALIVGSIFFMATQGLSFGIDFTGGTIIEIRAPETPDLKMMRSDLNDLGLGSVSIQEFGAPEDLLIRLPGREATAEEQAKTVALVKDELSAFFKGGEIDYRRVEFVGPQVGKELKLQGLYAVLFSLGGILVYIWFRFEWQYGMAAVVALIHDTLITIGLFALTQAEFNLSTVAAILTIAGYSINDTVVVFDRIRENLRKYKKKPLLDLFNMSTNEMLSRTLMTSFSTLIALVALYAFGGEVIRGFVFALIFGIVIGTYSSVFIAAPVLILLNVKRGLGDAVPSGAEQAG